MRLLLDSSMWGPTAIALRAAGHDVDWIGDWPADPGDQAILGHARDHDRVLVTLDNDFGELAVRHRIEHRGIIRVARTPVSLEASVCIAAIAAYRAEMEAGAIVTASPRRIRVRRAQQPDDL